MNSQTLDSSSPIKNINELSLNFKETINIVFTDLDGTIVPIDNNFVKRTVSQKTIFASNKLKKLNIPLIFATGRAKNEVQDIVDAIGNENAYFILQLGAEVIDYKGNIIYENYISGSDIKLIIEDFLTFKNKHNLNSKYYFVVDGKQYSTEPFTLPYNGEKVFVIDSLDYFGKDFSAGKILIYEPEIEKGKLIQNHLLQKFPNLSIDLSAGGYCDITLKEATKGKAIEQLAAKLKVNLKNAVVFGDAENDISMFQTIKACGGLTIAVENAMDKLKQQADFITKSVDNDGFDYAIEKILENNIHLIEQKETSQFKIMPQTALTE